MRRLPIAKTELRDIVEGDFLYADKTRFVKQLLDEGHGYYFLARPRRFGKSLFLDTLRAAFAGEMEVFNGLYLENNWDWDIKYPVLKISFGRIGIKNADELKNALINIVNSHAIENNLNINGNYPFELFFELIKNLSRATNKQVVLLIDEYDKPILDNLTSENVSEIRDELSNFYSVLKDSSQFLKFVFLTGISKFSKTNIFSKLNNLTDISLVPKYADICGITQNELDKQNPAIFLFSFQYQNTLSALNFEL